MQFGLNKPVATHRPTWQFALPGVLAAALLMWVLVVALLWWKQEALLFRPTVLDPGYEFNLPADVHERWIDVPGARLNALHLRQPNPKGVVYYLHGNGGSLKSWFVNPEFYRALDLDLFMIDYRGFGKSSGSIRSQEQLIADVRAAWAAVAAGYAGKTRVFFGRSLGTGLAAQLAAEVQPELTVLVSPYQSILQLAAEKYPFVPSAVLRYPLRTDLALPQLRGRLLLLHGQRDTTIPFEHSQRLAALPIASGPPQLLLLPEAGHNDIHQFDAYLSRLRSVLSAAR